MDPYCSEVPIDYRAERPKRSWDEREYDYERRRQRSRSKEKETRRRDRSRSRERWRNEDCDHGDRPRGRRREGSYERECGGGGGGGGGVSGGGVIEFEDCKQDGSDHHTRSRDRDHWEHDLYENDGEEDDRGVDYSHVEPGPVVMLRNLRDDVHKEDVSRGLGSYMSYVRDIRLVIRRDGPGRSFAFVEFFDASDAKRWVEENKDTLELLGTRVNVEFSHHRRLQDHRERSHYEDRDWTCFKCGTLNFARRRVCLTCDCPKTESDNLHEDVRQGRIPDERKEIDRDEKNPPSNVLILKGLDALSTEESVSEAINAVCPTPVKDVRLIKDKSTNTSKGFCFVELGSLEEAKTALEVLHNQYPAFFIDGRRVNVSFARQNNPPSSKSNNNMASAAIAQAQWSLSLQTTSNAIQQSYPTSQTSQQALQQAHASSAHQSSMPAAPAQDQSMVDYSLPTTYCYDATTGFYYDSATGLYYDPKTQYHYNSQTGQYCYYDSAKQAYIPVASDGTPLVTTDTLAANTTADTSTAAATKGKKKKDGAAGGGVSAKKIAKDMERWAKTVNAAAKTVQQHTSYATPQGMQQQEAVTIATPRQLSPEPQRPKMVTLSSVLEKEDEKASRATVAVDISDAGNSGGTSTAGSLPAGADPVPEHTDWDQLVCLLCKRKFGSKDILIKHQQFSDLHKQNLELKKKSAVVNANAKSALQDAIDAQEAHDTQEAELTYRDRAKERRAKYGAPEAIVPGWKRRLEEEMARGPSQRSLSPPPLPPSTETRLGEDNKGSKMMQAMGWSHGQGLGKSNQGIVDPIQAEMRTKGSGLGAPGSSIGVYSSSGTYKDSLKQLTRARFMDMFNK